MRYGETDNLRRHDGGRLLAQRAHDAGRNVLLTTGSHTLGVYAERIAPERLYARVLPTAASLAACESAGIPRSHIIAMQGRSARGSTTRCMRSGKLPSW